MGRTLTRDAGTLARLVSFEFFEGLAELWDPFRLQTDFIKIASLSSTLAGGEESWFLVASPTDIAARDKLEGVPNSPLIVR